MNANDFINSLDNTIYNKLRKSKSDAECRRYLREHLIKEHIVGALNASKLLK